MASASGDACDADACPFCHIAQSYPPYDPLQPPLASDPLLSSTRTRPSHAETFVVLSVPLVVAFLDIMPLAEGHLLLCPRAHREKLSAVHTAEATDLGRWLRVLSRALARATGVDDWNIVQNNGAAAAQVVPHTHFHIIPRPDIRRQGRFAERFTMFGRGQRTDLDEEEAARLAEKVRQCVAEVLGEDKEDDGRAKI